MALVGLLWPLVGLISFVGFVWLCVVAFKQHVGWGLAVFFLSPFAAVFFAIKHWRESRTPFLVFMGSFVLMLGLAFYSFSALGGFEMMAMASEIQQGDLDDQEAMVRMMEKMEQSGMLDDEQKAELQRMQQMVEQARQSSGDGDASTDEGSGAVAPVDHGATVEPEVEPGATEERPSRRTVALSDERSPIAPDDALGTDPSDLVPPGFKRVDPLEAADYLGRTVRIVGKDGTQHRGRLADVRSGALLVERHLSAGTISFELSPSEVDSMLVGYR